MYEIREATISDAETIKQIAETTWPECYGSILEPEQVAYMLNELYSAEKLASQMQHTIQTYLLLLEDGEPAGFAAFSPREENADVYKLHKLYCLPAKQGKGYGKALMNAVIDRVKAAGKHTLELNVNRHNKAKGAYEKMGFEVIYEEDIPIGPYFMNDFVMRINW